MWDAESQKVAIRPIKKKDARSYRVNFSSKHAGAGIAAKAFCDHIKYNYSETRKFAATWSDAESAIEIDLKEEEVAKQKFEVHKRHSRIG